MSSPRWTSWTRRPEGRWRSKCEQGYRYGGGGSFGPDNGQYSKHCYLQIHMPKFIHAYFTRFLDPDTKVLLSELGSSTSKKFQQLNQAIATLVGSLVHWQLVHACILET